MPTIIRSKTCTSSRSAAIKSCPAPCPGHGTRTVCPPLIVLAVLSSEQAAAATQR